MPFDLTRHPATRHLANLIARLRIISLIALSTTARSNDSVVVFNEVHYHPAEEGAPLEFVELHNQLAVEVDLSNWRIDGDIDFDFPEGTIVPPRGYLVIAQDPDALLAATGHPSALGPYNRKLSNSGGMLRLSNNNLAFRSQPGSGSLGETSNDHEGRRIMDELDYRDNHPWPVGPDGSGFSLAKLDPDRGTSDPGNWGTSGQRNGSPGSANDIPTSADVSFNEVTSSETADFRIELHNHGDSPVDLGGLVISSSDDSATDHVLPSSTLAAGGFHIVHASPLGVTPGNNSRLFLLGEGKTDLIDAIRVDDSPAARIPDGTGRWAHPSTLTLGSANDVSLETGIVINEIFYHAKSRPESGHTSMASTQVLDFSSSWRYNLTAGTTGLPIDWASTNHPADQTDWAAGPGLLGVENSVLGEPIETGLSLSQQVTYYFESDFLCESPDSVTSMVIQHYVDDGAVFYLNGVEIGRFNMGPGPVTASTVASSGVGNASLQTLLVSSPPLLTGSNRISVEVHQADSGSSDIVFGAQVRLNEEISGNHTPYAERDEEWIELYNRDVSEIDLTGWKLSGGIDYDFPSGSRIPSGGYLVIAKNPADLSSKFPSITVLGGYSGRLGNGGDHIILEDSHGNPADEVSYHDSGRWHEGADGGGSSLELRDADADNSSPAAWAISNESSRSQWQTYSHEAIATEDGIGLDTFHELQIGLLDSGELLIDDVSVIENGTLELIQNGTFENDIPGTIANKWRAIGTHGSHGRTLVITDPGDSGNRCLHVVATGPTENKHNKLETTFANNEEIVIGNTYRVSFRAKWLSGSSQLNTHLYFNYLQKTHILDSPEIWGSPGTTNTRAVANAGPDLAALSHSPVVPDAGQAVTVGIDASDPDGIQELVLSYSVDGGSHQETPMTLSGRRYVATLPGQPASAVIRFHVQATDTSGMTSHHPEAGPEGGAFYKVQDGLADTSGVRRNFRIIMDESDRDFLFLDTNRMSNDRLPATVIEDETKVYYDVQLRLKASANGRYKESGYGFNIRFHPDQRFRGVHDTISVERGELDRQMLAKALINRAGIGYSSFYDDVAHLIPPTVADRGVCLLALSRHTANYWDGFFSDSDGDGTLFNLEMHYEPVMTAGGPEDLKLGTPFQFAKGQYNLVDRGGEKEPYRWGFQIRSARDRDDYDPIIALNQAVGNLSGPELKAALDPLIDIDQWMRTLAMIALNGTDDVYTRFWQHNFRFFVRPTDGKIIVMQWDLDRAFRLATNLSTIPSVSRDGTPYPVTKVFEIPEYRRIFDGHLHDLIQTTFNSNYAASISDGLGTAIGTDVNFTNYIAQRAANVQASLPDPVPFAITTHGGADFSEQDSAVALSGTGSHQVFAIEVNGNPVQVTWSGSDQWMITVPIGVGANPLTLTARNHHGVIIASDMITVTNTSNVDLADASNTLITELHYHPALPSPAEEAAGFNEDNDFEFVELMNTSTTFVDYGGVHFTHGVAFNIPAGTVLAPGERVVLVANESAFNFRYGTNAARVIGEYAGKLSNGGEHIRLAAADTDTIAEFTYSDDPPWAASPDGDGFSLVLRGDSPGNADHWRPSIGGHGNPGTTDSMTFGGGDLVGYLLATAPVATRTEDSFFIELTVHTAADDATFQVQFSDDLTNWTTATDIDLRSHTDHPDGTSTYRYETPISIGDRPAHFARALIETR